MRRQRGSALLLCLIVLIVLVGISGAYLSISLINSRKTTRDVFALQALYIAESAAHLEISRLNRTGGVPVASVTPVALAGGAYTIPVVVDFGMDGEDNNKDGLLDANDEFEQKFFRLEFEGAYSETTRRLELILTRSALGVYGHTIFAGNSSEDPTYTLRFGGPDANTHDLVHGDVYSGGSLSTGGYAEFLNEEGGTDPKPTGRAAMEIEDTSLTNVDPVFTHERQPGLQIEPGAANPSISLYEERTLNGEPGYVNVAAELAGPGAAPGYVLGEQAGQGSYGTNPDGSSHGGGNCGLAVQISGPDAVHNPAHIFRKNPTDMNDDGTPMDVTRAERWFGEETIKEDYFLEDPTQYARHGYTTNDTNAQLVDLGPNGNDKVFVIDGNLWANNSPTYTFKFLHNESNMKVTFVIKGNLYLSDNLYYHNKEQDALAIIAIEDPLHPNAAPADFASDTQTLPNGMVPSEFAASVGVSDLTSAEGLQEASRLYNRLYGSGNIFFGDAVGGTTEHFEAFMYAENNFYDNNLGDNRTNMTDIYGNMTAGNQVLIERDFEPYKPLKVLFDDKIKTNRVVPPDLPPTPGSSTGTWFIASWKQIP